jgi:hypothetical protein
MNEERALVQGPLSEWAQQLIKAMTTTGDALDAEGFSSLGDFILSCMRDCIVGGAPARATHLITELVRLTSFIALAWLPARFPQGRAVSLWLS